jgi:serine protease Do
MVACEHEVWHQHGNVLFVRCYQTMLNSLATEYWSTSSPSNPPSALESPPKGRAMQTKRQLFSWLFGLLHHLLGRDVFLSSLGYRAAEFVIFSTIRHIMETHAWKGFMNKQVRFHAFHVLICAAVLLALNPPAIANEIDACKYLLVPVFQSDPYGIANALRAQAQASGFVVISAVTEVPLADQPKACVMTGSWNQGAFGVSVSVRVVDAVSGDVIGDASTATGGLTYRQAARSAARKLYEQLGYKGYNEASFQSRIARLYPPRPKYELTEAQIKSATELTPIEGIWSDPQNEYRLGIVKAPEGSTADYIAVILNTTNPLWQPNEIKAEIRSTAAASIFTATIFLGNKKAAGTTLTLDHDAVLRGSVAGPNGTVDLTYLRVWPKLANEPVTATSEKSGKSGTGFLISRSGLIATNWHVVSDANRISVSFPGWREGTNADVVVRDTANDLAILRLTDASKLVDLCPDLPFQLTPTQNVVLGQHVSTIGYPLSPLLGSNPKFSEGAIAGKSGLQDDPRWFQISAAIQPGSSGSPLFDDEGNIIGIVVASLDAAKAYQLTGTVPQNVNWAIKSDYLLNLLGMLPKEKLSSRMADFSPEKAAACVAVITAW